jgi:polyferredoxin/NAD-dependent dihydropyrimidine dehydrogenase PreA subunit
MRTAVQALSLLLFSLLFLFANYKLPDWLPADVYLRLDPLLGLSAVLAGKEVVTRALWSLILIGATVVIGRFFCGYVCPLGAAIDFLDLLLFRQKARREVKADVSLRRVKFSLLILFLSAALGGITLTYLMDPLALLTRFYTFVLYPLAITLVNVLLDLLRPLFQALGWIGLAHLSYTQPVYYMSLITLLIFGGIIALNHFTPRFFCRYLCPLGALLGLISPLGLFKRRVGPDCNACDECRAACPMGAPGDVPENIRLSECIQCRTCVEACHQKAVAFPAFPSSDHGGEYLPVEVSRRGFLYSVTGGLSLAFLVDRTPFTRLQGKRQLIRPPGALPEAEFMRTCVRCAECMKSCPTNTLQPCLWESGLAGLWTPKMDLRFAACEQNCNVCGKVCPTQAIRSLSLEEKTHAKVGTAVLNRDLCLVWAQDKLCLICDEICPYNAIVFRTLEGYRRPVVIASRCNGCGFCEQRCPVQGESAIIVATNGEIRLKEGSYIEGARKLQLEFKPDPGDDRFILEESGIKVEEEKVPRKGATPKGTTPPKKPKGFL